MTGRGLAIVAVCGGLGIAGSSALLVVTQYAEHRHDPTDLLTVASGVGVRSVAVRDAGGADIWLIRSSNARHPRYLRYGVVPSGYEQVTPEPGVAPRPFVAGERLTLVFVTADGTIVHEGVAVGNSGVAGGVSTFTPGHVGTGRRVER